MLGVSIPHSDHCNSKYKKEEGRSSFQSERPEDLRMY